VLADTFTRTHAADPCTDNKVVATNHLSVAFSAPVVAAARKYLVAMEKTRTWRMEGDPLHPARA